MKDFDFELGQTVYLDGEIEARVCGLAVYYGGRVLVQCAWWHNGSRHEQWLEAFEVRAARGKAK